MRRIVQYFLIVVVFLSMKGFSQIVSFDTIPSATSSMNKKQDHLILRKLDFGIQIGTQFTASSNASGFSTSVSPHLTYGFNKRLSISGGVSIINTSLSGFSYSPLSHEEFSLNSNFTSAMVFLSGQYLVNDKLTISGTAYKQFHLSGDMPGLRSNIMNHAQGIYMNVRYKILENVHLDAGFGYSKGYNPYNSFYNDPFDRSFGDPFYRPIR